MTDRVNVYDSRSGRIVREDSTDVNIGDVLTRVQSPFNEFRTASKTSLVELKSTFGLSALRDIQNTEGSGAVTHANSEFKLATTANGPDVAELRSAEAGRYVPGIGAEAGIGVRIPNPDSLSGSQQLDWGIFGADTGYGFGKDTTSLYVFRRGGGTTEKIRRSNWNHDKLDGSGPSGYTLDLSDGHIFRITFSWYGYGVIEYRVVTTNSQNEQIVTPVHREREKGSVSTVDPNVPVTARVDNGGTASSFEMFVAGRSYDVIGNYNPNVRSTSDERLNVTVSSSFEPLVSFRLKDARKSTPVKTDGFDVITDQSLVVALILDGSLTGASFGTPSDTTAAETACETDTSATAISGGEMIWRGLLESGQGNNKIRMRQQDILGLRLPFDKKIMSLVAKRFPGASDANVSSVARFQEEW